VPAPPVEVPPESAPPPDPAAPYPSTLVDPAVELAHGNLLAVVSMKSSTVDAPA
jgi:hypothetical protein